LITFLSTYESNSDLIIDYAVENAKLPNSKFEACVFGGSSEPKTIPRGRGGIILGRDALMACFNRERSSALSCLSCLAASGANFVLRFGTLL